MTINNRIELIVNELNLNNNSFAVKLGVNPTITHNIIKGRNAPSYDLLNKISLTFDNINADWLLTGKGNITKELAGKTRVLQEPAHAFVAKTDRAIREQDIPLYDLEAVAGLVPLFNDTTNYEPISTLRIPNIGKADGALYVTGDSMYPILKSGDIVVYKQVYDKRCVVWGEIYLLSFSVDGDDYTTIKYIQRAEHPEYIRLVSHNQHHSPMEVHVDTVRALALIKASVRYNVMR